MLHPLTERLNCCASLRAMDEVVNIYLKERAEWLNKMLPNWHEYVDQAFEIELTETEECKHQYNPECSDGDVCFKCGEVKPLKPKVKLEKFEQLDFLGIPGTKELAKCMEKINTMIYKIEEIEERSNDKTN